jgi:2-dehydro-3-deoxyphosphogluconate aldolase/(4S)-4-hydroxy-2-oxoglutarate aldolase
MSPHIGSDPALPRCLLGRRIIAVVRADEIPDAAALCAALYDGGIRAVEFTFTTPRVEAYVRTAIDRVPPDMAIGLGTVLTGTQAQIAIDAGAQYLVTPCVRPEVISRALSANVPVLVGAMSPTEVYTAHDAGAGAVKIFPAATLGVDYIADLRAPFPQIPLVPSGGITARNAEEFLSRGAAAICVGGSVVSPALVRDAQWGAITVRAAEVVAAIDGASR